MHRLSPLILLLSLIAIGLAKLCPNPEYSCPEDSTCCLLADDVPPGEYGCCPMPEATCCEDHIHCCPGGQQCNVEEGSCYAADGSVSKMLRKFRARKTNKPIEEDEVEIAQPLNADVICPDGKQRCPELTTCCELETGQFGCCPAPNAVCCQDHMHCCPDGYRCDASSERCRQKDASEMFGVRVIPSLRKFPATKNVIKPSISYRDAKSRRSGTEMQKRPVNCGNNVGCSKGHTCCEALDDESGPFPETVCCPMADAVCCDHGCCPRGYACSKDGRDCERPALSENAQYLRLLKKAWFNED